MIRFFFVCFLLCQIIMTIHLFEKDQIHMTFIGFQMLAFLILLISTVDHER